MQLKKQQQKQLKKQHQGSQHKYAKYCDTNAKNVKQLGQFTTEKPEIKTSVNGNTALNSTKYANKIYSWKQRTQGDNTYVLIQNNKDNTPIGWANSKRY